MLLRDAATVVLALNFVLILCLSSPADATITARSPYCGALDRPVL